MAAAVAALLALVLPLALSGYATYAQWAEVFGREASEALHEFFANALLMVVLLHLGLIAALSLLRGKNQAQAMLSGRIDGNGPDRVKHSHAWLAALLLIAVLAFGARQWQQAPAGLLPDAPRNVTDTDRDHDEAPARR